MRKINIPETAQLTESHLQKIKGGGVKAKQVAFELGIGRLQACELLKKNGASYNSNTGLFQVFYGRQV